MKKLSYEHVENYMQGRNCKLLSKTYKNNSQRLEIMFSCGHVGKRNFQKFKEGLNICSRCSGVGQYSFSEVKDYFKENGFQLLESEYVSCKDHLKYKDKDGYYYKSTFDRFMRNIVGRDCNPARFDIYNPYTIRNLKNFLKLSRLNLSLEKGQKWTGNSTKMTYYDNYGYKYWTDFACLLSEVKIGSFPGKFDISNKYTLYNLKNYIKINDKNFSLVPDQTYKGNRTHLFFQCNDCGELFSSKIVYITGSKECPFCKETSGEKRIRKVLEKRKENFESQFKFNDCIFVTNLVYDFYLMDVRVGIEFQGKQHYEPIKYFGGEQQFKLQSERDETKRNYCKENNIKLIEIPYWDYKNIESILTKELNLSREEEKLFE